MVKLEYMLGTPVALIPVQFTYVKCLKLRKKIQGVSITIPIKTSSIILRFPFVLYMYISDKGLCTSDKFGQEKNKTKQKKCNQDDH